MKLLLDTHVLIWWVHGDDRLPDEHRRALEEIGEESPVLVSDISLWEIATLHRLGKIELTLPLRDWLEHAAAPPLVRRLGVTPAIAATTAELPDDLPGDPADRILVATAKVLGATLLTRDRAIIDAAAVQTL